MRTIIVAALLAALCTAAWAETYGNFNTMGIIVDCPEGYKPADIARVRLYGTGGGERRELHDLVQVGSLDYFAGSVFWLEPDTEYAFEVEFYDRGGKLAGRSAERGRTRREPVASETAADAGGAIVVSPTGRDDGPGTLGRPLKTVAAALAKAGAGTTVFLREGRYYEGGLSPARGGAAGSPVVIRNYPGERAILDGAEEGLVEAEWRGGPARTWSAPFTGSTWNVSMEEKATGKYFRLYPLRTMQELTERVSAGKTFERLGFTGAYHCDGERIHLATPGGDIGEYHVHVSVRTRGLEFEGRSHVSVEGLEFRHYGEGAYGCAVFLLNSSEVVVRDCSVYYTNTGVWLKGASSNVTVQDSVFIDDLNHWHFEYSKNPQGWDYHGQIETGAVYTDGRYTGRGLVFRRNTLVGLFDGANVGPVSEAARTSETDFHDNRVEGITDDFIETDGLSRNVRIFENRMEKSLSGVSLAQALDGPTWIIYNTIIDSGVSVATRGENWEGYPFKTNGGPRPDIGSGPIFFYHNTAWTSDPASRAILVKSNVRWRVLVLYNNIWHGRAMGFDKWSGELSPMDWDYDNLYHAAGPFMKMSGRVFQTLAEAQRALPVMQNGISADPRLMDPEGGDFRLGAGSPCIDAGAVIYGINDTRYRGKAPDIGCFEAEGAR